MVKKSGFLRAIVLGSAIAAGLAFNSTDALAAEVEEEPLGNTAQADETQPDAEQDESIQKMEDATEVVEGDLVAEKGYLEEANDAIEAGEMTSEKADELLENGEEILKQAEEKNNLVEEEYAKIEEEANEAEAEFKEEAAELGLEDLVEQVDTAETIDEKLDIVDDYKETLVAEYDKEVEACQENQRHIDYNQEEIETYTPYIEQYQKEYEEAKKEYDDAYSEYYRLYYWWVDYYNVLANEQRELRNTIAAIDEEIKNNEGNEEVIEELQAKKEEALAKYQEQNEELIDIERANGDYYWMLQIYEEEELEPYITKMDEAFYRYDDVCGYIYVCELNIKEYTEAIEESTARQAKLITQIENYDKIEATAKHYISSLEKKIEAEALVERSNTAYKEVLTAYNTLKDVIAEYKNSVSPEPEITEVTTTNSYTQNVSQTLKDVFTGITAVAEGAITTKITTVTKTITDKVNKIRKTIVSTQVNVIASACVKIYDRCGGLITTLYDNVNFQLPFFFFRFFRF